MGLYGCVGCLKQRRGYGVLSRRRTLAEAVTTDLSEDGRGASKRRKNRAWGVLLRRLKTELLVRGLRCLKKKMYLVVAGLLDQTTTGCCVFG